jgi:hypothetical protein
MFLSVRGGGAARDMMGEPARPGGSTTPSSSRPAALGSAEVASATGQSRLGGGPRWKLAPRLAQRRGLGSVRDRRLVRWRVVAAVAGGARLFLSRRTVQYHLGNHRQARHHLAQPAHRARPATSGAAPLR